MLTVTLVSALMTNDAVAQPDSLESVLHGDVKRMCGFKEGKGEGRERMSTARDDGTTSRAARATRRRQQRRRWRGTRLEHWQPLSAPLSKRPLASDQYVLDGLLLVY